MPSCFRTAFLTVVFALPAAPPGRAETCPDKTSGRTGFVVERGAAMRTEVFHDGPIVRTMMRSGGNALLETTQFEGLFELDRVDRGHRTAFTPKSDLKAFFPLKPKQRITVQFAFRDDKGAERIRAVELVVGDAEDLYVGRCKFHVLKIERSESRSGDPPRFFNWDYYAPDLKLVVAKGFREREGRTSLIKFDKIFALESKPASKPESKPESKPDSKPVPKPPVNAAPERRALRRRRRGSAPARTAWPPRRG